MQVLACKAKLFMVYFLDVPLGEELLNILLNGEICTKKMSVLPSG
jgi:hypothetical protein